MTEHTRREFLQGLATAAGGMVLLPVVTACTDNAKTGSTTSKPGTTSKPSGSKKPVPVTKPEKWDPVAYNKERGLAGAIPKTYHPSITGADGDKKHLGKHLPFQAKVDAKLVPAGYIALMWGDTSKGHAAHPNAPKSEKNPAGHWYNWIKVRKAAEGEAKELQSTFSDWPGIGPKDNGKYLASDGGDVKANAGKNTVYLTALPSDVKKGDVVRIWAHCLTHGEYVDFLTV